MLTFGTGCTGIGAPEQAVAGFGWHCAWQAEINPASCRVLAVRYGASAPERTPDPDQPGISQKERQDRLKRRKALAKVQWPAIPTVRNLGDFATIADRILAGEVDAPDVFIAGTPCQDFSVAGLREGLAGERGNLSLEFILILDAIDSVRRALGKAPCIAWWENVPGVLSDSDNAFGAILGGLVGSQSSIPRPPRQGWTRSGVVDGPTRRAAWRILDAQHHGLAQRRERVFVLARGGVGDWTSADALLPIIESVRWHSSPRREARENIARPLAGGPPHGSGYRNDADTAENLVAGTLDASAGGADEDIVAETLRCHPRPGSNSIGATIIVEGRVAPTIDASYGRLRSCSGQDLNHGHGHVATALRARDLSRGVDSDCTDTLIAHTLRGTGFDAREDGTGRGTPLVAVSVALRGRDGGATAELGDDTAFALRASQGGGDKPHVLAFTQNSRDELRYVNGDGEIAGALASQPGMKQQNFLQSEMAVRRLMPIEAERLQGFSDGFTDVDGLADGPRYEMLGNSMAVSVISSIGKSIHRILFGETL